MGSEDIKIRKSELVEKKLVPLTSLHHHNLYLILTRTTVEGMEGKKEFDEIVKGKEILSTASRSGSRSSNLDQGRRGRPMKELERIHVRERIEREKSLIRDISQVNSFFL